MTSRLNRHEICATQLNPLTIAIRCSSPVTSSKANIPRNATSIPTPLATEYAAHRLRRLTNIRIESYPARVQPSIRNTTKKKTGSMTPPASSQRVVLRSFTEAVSRAPSVVSCSIRTEAGSLQHDVNKIPGFIKAFRKSSQNLEMGGDK